jgi:hypothetical protein
MRHEHQTRRLSSALFAVAAVFAMAAALFLTATSQAQAPAPMALGQPCNTKGDSVKAPVQGDPRVATPIDAALLKGDLPCSEEVSGAEGPLGDDELRNLQRGFDFYSWLSFIALNAPADNSGIANSQPGTKAKWEDTRHFIQLLDVMRADGVEPKWNETNTDKTAMIPPACRPSYTPGMMVVEMIEESYNQPFRTGPLIDQRGHFALFDILMNETMFKYIVGNKLHQQVTQREFPLRIDFPAGANPKPNPASSDPPAGPGSFMLKVSWKIIDPADDKSKFHTVEAIVLLPGSPGQPPADRACLKKTLGLIGFHAVHKTANRPQWIWTSFEHVDNAPEQSDVDAGLNHLGRRYNFFDPSCDRAKCPVNETPPRPWAPNSNLNHQTQRPTGFQSQITRVVPLTEDTKDINGKFQNLLRDTVWKNYMLIGTQWPSDFPCATAKSADSNPFPRTNFEKEPDMNCAPAPTYLANTTLETFSQGVVPQASSSCMACHGNATSFQRSQNPNGRLFNQSDFTFILEKAPPPRN